MPAPAVLVELPPGDRGAPAEAVIAQPPRGLLAGPPLPVVLDEDAPRRVEAAFLEQADGDGHQRVCTRDKR